uniref:Uncharacterized protein n=1 Tax=Astyanax mexicanus TaxID=7994 RepID=A0A8B9JAP2_ASTMX
KCYNLEPQIMQRKQVHIHKVLKSSEISIFYLLSSPHPVLTFSTFPSFPFLSVLTSPLEGGLISMPSSIYNVIALMINTIKHLIRPLTACQSKDLNQWKVQGWAGIDLGPRR